MEAAASERDIASCFNREGADNLWLLPVPKDLE